MLKIDGQFLRLLRSVQLASAVMLLFVVTAIRVAADIHPVPLEKNVDSAKCLECHADKGKGKAVHTAISTGCTTCHEVRVNRDATYVKLTTSTPYRLCVTCHADKKAAEIKGTVHPPAARDCLKCHDPHQSDNKNQLLKTTSGDAKENLCLTCHSIGVNPPVKGSRHAALDMGCETCHLTHKTGERGKVEFDYHLTKSTPGLCLDCHDANDAALQKAHQDQPFATADCVSCHDPHQSKLPKLMAKYTHPPFADKQCEMCHAPAKDGKIVLAQADVKAICGTCHDEKLKQIETAKVQHPGAAGDCTDCHNPHASNRPGLPKTNGVDVCLTCHTDQAEMTKTAKALHEPAFGEGCGTCHEPHGSERAKLLRAEGNALCLECHGPNVQPVKAKDSDELTIFEGKVTLPANYFLQNKVVFLPLKNGKGHPTPSHPTEDIRDLNDLTKVKTQISCLSCHQSHAGASHAMLAKNQTAGMDFCRSCHKGSIGDQVQ
jgi:predicted CXXCH cytochrome family protein